MRTVFKLRYNIVDLGIVMLATEFDASSGYELWHIVLSGAFVVVGIAVSTTIGSRIGISQRTAP